MIAPFAHSDGLALTTATAPRPHAWRAASPPSDGIDGGQGEAVRVPLADGTLVAIPGSGHSEETMRSLLTLSDVMGTGHHAAVCAGVEAGECVGTGRAVQTALSIARPGSMAGYVGVPHGVEFPVAEMFHANKGVRGCPAPARTHIPLLLDDVLEGRIDPGRVLDFETGLDGIADAYAAMGERRAIKTLVRIATR